MIRTLLLLFLVMTLVSSPSEMAHAGFLVPIIFGAAFAATLTGTIVVAAANIALAVGISFVAQKFLAKEPTSVPLASGTEVTLSVDPLTPEILVLGRCKVVGSLVYAETYGKRGDTDNSDMIEIIALADHVCEGLVGVMVEGNPVSYSPQGLPVSGRRYGVDAEDRGQIVHAYSNKLAFQFYDGTQTQVDLLTYNALQEHPERPYLSTAVGRGRCYARTHTIYDPEVANGQMPWSWVIDGALLYDPRLDTTVGGSGSHRWNDLSTHTFSRNIAVFIYNILRGIRVQGEDGPQHFYGLEGVEAEDLPLDNWFAAMNEADELIEGEHQYWGGMVVEVSREPMDIIRELLKASDGRLSEVGGVYKIYLGPPGLSVLSFTDDQIVVYESQDFRPILPMEQRVNYVTASYIEPGDNWVERAAPPRGNADWEMEDGRRLPSGILLPAVQSGAHAQRLMKQVLLRSRRQRRHQVLLPQSCFGLEPGDVVDWTSERWGYDEKMFEVDSVEERHDLVLLVTLIELDPSDYDWSGADYIPQEARSVISVRPEPKIIEGFSAAGFAFEGAGGTVRPAIRVQWSAPEDGDLRRVEVQYRSPGSPSDVAVASTDDPSAEVLIILGSLTPLTDYEVRARFVSLSGLQTEWSLWQEVTTPDTRLTQSELSAALDARIRQIEEQIPQDLLTLRQDLEQVSGALVTQSSSVQEFLGWARVGAGARFAENQAGVEEVREAAATANDALAAFILELFAETANGSARGLIRFVVASTAEGALASFAMECRVNTGSTSWKTAGIYVDIMANLSGDAFGRIRLLADQMVFSHPDGTDAVIIENGFLKINNIVVPGVQIFNTPGTFSFTVPSYNQIRVRLYGGGGPGAGMYIANGSDHNNIKTFNGTIGTKSAFDEGGSFQLIANPGGVTTGSNAYLALRNTGGGPGGTASGGDTSTTGQAGTIGGTGGRCFGQDGGAARVTGSYNAAGPAGNPYGGGGAGVRNLNEFTSPGGGGAGFCEKTWTSITGPVFGTSKTVKVGTKGLANAGDGYIHFRKGGDGANGAVVIEWE